VAANFDKHDDYAWTIISAGAITGFNPAGFAVGAASFLNDIAGTFHIVQNANALQLVYSANPIPGDFNDDGQVDGADLITWKDSFGLGDDADADLDGDSDGADFLTWQRQLGAGAFSMAASTSVPEPSTWKLAAIVAALISRSSARSPSRVLQQRGRWKAVTGK
jgi:hypothetical protein